MVHILKNKQKEYSIEIRVSKEGTNRAEIQTLLEKIQRGSLMAEKSLWCQAVELAGNLSSSMAGKAICSQRSISWEVFCYNAIQRDAEGSSVCRGLMTTVPGRSWAGPGSYRKQAHQNWETKSFSCCNFSLVPSIYYLVPKIYYCTSRQRKNIERAHNHFHTACNKRKKKSKFGAENR